MKKFLILGFLLLTSTCYAQGSGSFNTGTGSFYYTGDAVQGEVSVGNTTTGTLAADATYTGTFEQNDYPDVMTSLQMSTSGTLYYDFSVDGSFFSTFPVNGFMVSAGIHEFHVAVKGSRYFRVRVENSSTNQTYMRMYTYYGIFGDRDWETHVFLLKP